MPACVGYSVAHCLACLFGLGDDVCYSPGAGLPEGFVTF
jgi:hypothetical protein